MFLLDHGPYRAHLYAIDDTVVRYLVPLGQAHTATVAVCFSLSGVTRKVSAKGKPTSASAARSGAYGGTGLVPKTAANLQRVQKGNRTSSRQIGVGTMLEQPGTGGCNQALHPAIYCKKRA
jgi:hypothetical protein